MVDAVRAALIESCPVPLSALVELGRRLEPTRGCRHSLVGTLAVIKALELPAEETIRWLRAHGGFCDCHVVATLRGLQSFLEEGETSTWRPALGRTAVRAAESMP